MDYPPETGYRGTDAHLFHLGVRHQPGFESDDVSTFWLIAASFVLMLPWLLIQRVKLPSETQATLPLSNCLRCCSASWDMQMALELGNQYDWLLQRCRQSAMLSSTGRMGSSCDGRFWPSFSDSSATPYQATAQLGNLSKCFSVLSLLVRRPNQRNNAGMKVQRNELPPEAAFSPSYMPLRVKGVRE